MELEAQKEAQELAVIKREKNIEKKIKNLEIEVEKCSSSSSLSNVSSSIRAEDRTKNWVNSPITKFGETSEPLVTAANLTANSQHFRNSGGNTSAATRTGEVKLDASQFNVAPGKATGLINDHDNTFFPSTVRQPAALPTSVPQSQITQVPMI